MTTAVSDWHVLPLLTLIATCLGMLGSLYLIYDLFGRQSMILYKCAWNFSAGFLFAATLLVSCYFFVGPDLLIGSEFFGLGTQIWRLTWTFSSVGFMMLYFLTVPLSMPVHPPRVDWRVLIFSLVMIGSGLIPMGTIIAPRGSYPILVLAVIFALPGILVYGTLAGFSPIIQWWVLHLPEKRVASIGAFLIFCAFALMCVQPAFYFLNIPLQ